MPFGLKNAPSVFQRAINCALGDLVHSYVVVYMDDVMVVAGTIDEALVFRPSLRSSAQSPLYVQIL